MNLNKRAKSLQRTLFPILLSMSFLFLSSCGEKEQKKVYKVGILCGLDYIAILSDGFKSKMTVLGYIEGENIVYDYQRTNFEPEKEEKRFIRLMSTKN